MTVTAKVLVPAAQIAATQATQYTATSVTAKITKATVTNTSAASVTFSCNLVASGGTASNSNLIVKTRTISAGETYTCPEIIGHVIEDGGFISTIASAATSLTFMVSGIEIS